MKYAIIGGGIGGLATALAFEQKGIDYQLFEKISVIRPVGAGIWLAPNALQVMESLGVLEHIQAKGNIINRITLAQKDLSPLSDNPQDAAVEQFGYSTVAIHRAKLQKILMDKIPTHKIHLGRPFQSFETLSDGTIKLFFEDDSEAITEFLIGSDGIHSKVRQQLFPKSKIRYTGQTCWRGVTNKVLDPAFRHRGMELWGTRVRFGISQISEDKVYWFAVALDKANKTDKIGLIRDKLLAMFYDFHPMVKALILSTPSNQIMRNDINDLKPMKNWYQDNICLIGDAGHATTPNMGQGGAQAIEDAYYLSHLIAQHPAENVFEIFQQKRQEKVNAIVKQSWTTGKLAHWQYGQRLRNFLLTNMPKQFLEKKMMELYQIENFEKSA